MKKYTFRQNILIQFMTSLLSWTYKLLNSYKNDLKSLRINNTIQSLSSLEMKAENLKFNITQSSTFKSQSLIKSVRKFLMVTPSISLAVVPKVFCTRQ